MKKIIILSSIIFMNVLNSFDQMPERSQLATSGMSTMKEMNTLNLLDKVTDPGKYESIKINKAAAANEIAFWSRQISEHMLFLYLGLVPKSLKAQALFLHHRLEKFRNDFKQIQSMEIMNALLPLLEEVREFKMHVLKELTSGKWIGWLFPLFIAHICFELDYFVNKLNGKRFSPDEEVRFWNLINGEHAGFAAHLLDPSEKELFNKALSLSEKFNDLPKTEEEMFIKMSLESSKELDKFNRTAQAKSKEIKSIIHPVLLAHVIREGRRSISTLENVIAKLKGGSIETRKIVKQAIEIAKKPVAQYEPLVELKEDLK